MTLLLRKFDTWGKQRCHISQNIQKLIKKHGKYNILFCYQKFVESVQLSCSYLLPKKNTGGNETVAAENQTMKTMNQIRDGADNAEYSKGLVIAWYRFTAMAHRLRMDAVHTRTSPVFIKYSRNNLFFRYFGFFFSKRNINMCVYGFMNRIGVTRVHKFITH